MVSTKEEFENIVRRTLEYQEARALLLELAELQEERARIRSELKKLRTFFPEVIRLAKSDVRHSSENDPDGSIAHCFKAAIKCDLPSSLPRELSADQIDTRLGLFLAAIDRIVAWERLDALVAPAYSREEWPERHLNVSPMVRLYFLHQWCGLSYKAIVHRTQDCFPMRAFVGINHRALPSEATLLGFKYVLEQNGLVSEIARIVTDGLVFDNTSVLRCMER
jgi:hypothetical protein